MNFKKVGVLLSVSTMLGMNIISSKALAQEPSIKFGQAFGQGNCTIADQLTGEDGRTLSIALDNFSAGNGVPRTKCIIRVDTTIPSGFHVQNLQILYQGSTSGSTTLSRSYIFNSGAIGLGKLPPKVTKFTSSNPLFQEQDDFTAVSASCGGTGQFGMNMVATATNGASIIIDTADVRAGDVKFHFDLVQCP
jgi:hypothetical protein